MNETTLAIARWRAIAVLAILAIAIAWSLAVRACRGDAAVEAGAVEQLAQQLDQRAGGRTVVIHPPWRDDVASQLRQQRPKLDVRLAAPLQAGLPTGSLALVRVGWSPGPGAFGDLAPSDRFAVGDLRVELYGGGAAGVAGRAAGSLLLADVAALRVRVEVGGRTIQCSDLDPSGPTHRCPTLPEWNHVGPHELVIGGQPRRCLWAHPISGGRVIIEAPWPLTANRIKVSYGLADSAVGAPDGQPVTLEVFAGERKLGGVVQPNQFGYGELTVPLGEPASERLAFVVSTTHDGARHFCIDAVAERGPAPVAPATRPAAESQP
ncbi:MAG: hypothetical protein JXR83_12005 [Deltaproteobacteria bacterium]|nr:hypothetical protein [Deltaproteobacteria bacterium]